MDMMDVSDSPPKAFAPPPSPIKARQAASTTETNDPHEPLEWWDFLPLAEPSARRPIVWSSANSILTAHPNQPLVVGRFFPPANVPGRQESFILPAPPAILSSMGSYAPPTILTLKAPSSDWLFAYFPGRVGDGLGCLWLRNSRQGLVDSWATVDSWFFARGDAPVAATWLFPQREWSVAPDGSPVRLPTRGPMTPLTYPVVLVVTQTQHVQACFLRAFVAINKEPVSPHPTLRRIRCSLKQMSQRNEVQPLDAADEPEVPGCGVTVCTSAAFGIPYADSSVIVAMRTRAVPPASSSGQNMPEFLAMGLDISDDVRASHDDVPHWEIYGEQTNIDLCELHIGFDGHGHMNLYTLPLTPIQHSAPVSRLEFLAIPPAIAGTDSKGEGPSMTIPLYLVVSSLDFGDYDDQPTSELKLYAFNTRVPNPIVATNAFSARWLARQVTSRRLTDATITFLQPCPAVPQTMRARLLVGFVAHQARPSRNRSGMTTLGEARVLKLPDLSDDDDWAPMPLRWPADPIVPLDVAIAPSSAAFAVATTSMAIKAQVALQIFPPYRPKSSQQPQSDSISQSNVAACLVTAICQRKSACDVSYVLSQSSVNLAQVESVLEEAMRILQNGQWGPPDYWAPDFFRIALEVYRTRGESAKHTIDKGETNARWNTAQAVCSVLACDEAFRDCHEDGSDSYDLDAVWQLIGMACWFIELLETVLKECILTATSMPLPVTVNPKTDQEEVGDELFGSAPPSPAPKQLVFADDDQISPLLLLLAHPFTLNHIQAMIAHIRNFRAQLASLPASGESAHIAKDILLDAVDCSGLDFNGLHTLLATFSEELKAVDGSHFRKSLAMCRPSPDLKPFLAKAVHKLATSTVVDKALLFIKPSDLLDGMSDSVFTEQDHLGKDKSTDVITKGRLVKPGSALRCLRCEGLSQALPNVGAGHASTRWRAWEKKWAARCMCGGFWVAVPV